MGPLEILIVLIIALVVFGGYKKLPQLGRSAGTNARIGSEKAREFADRNTPRAKELASQVGEKAGDRFDPAALGRSAGKGVREARDLRDSFKGTLDTPAKEGGSREADAAAAPPGAAPAPSASPAPAAPQAPPAAEAPEPTDAVGSGEMEPVTAPEPDSLPPSPAEGQQNRDRDGES